MSRFRPVRVLHFLSSLHVGSGMMHAVLNYQHHIDSNRVQFDYLYMNDYEPSLKKEVEALGSKCFYVPFRGAGLPGSCQRDFFREHAGEWDVLHCHPIFGAEMLGWAARRNGIPHVIAHSHSTRFSDKAASAKRNRLITHTIGLFATDYVACSDAARALLLGHGKDAYIMRNAADCDAFSFDAVSRDAIRQELGVGDRTMLLGHLGRLSPEKNQDFLLQVANELLNRKYDFKLAIAGSGALRDQLKKKATEMGLSDVISFLGSRPDASSLYSGFDCFLLPSIFEGLPVSAVEAQISGLPCFISNTVASEALFGPGEMLPIDQGPKLWADAIENLQIASETKRREGPLRASMAGYDISLEARKLMTYYEGMVGR